MLQALKETLWPWGRTAAVKASNDWDWTPDIPTLEQYATQLLFVPDNMKKGGKHHDVLKTFMVGNRAHNERVYTHNKFLAYKQDLGEHSNAIVMPGDYIPSGFVRGVNPARVQGELYSVDAFRIYLLDKFRQNGVQYARQRIRVTYPYRVVSKKRDSCVPPTISPHCFTTITAWMYVGIPKYWDSRIGGVFAQPLPLHEHVPPRQWIGEFYRFEIEDH